MLPAIQKNDDGTFEVPITGDLSIWFDPSDDTIQFNMYQELNSDGELEGPCVFMFFKDQMKLFEEWFRHIRPERQDEVRKRLFPDQ